MFDKSKPIPSSDYLNQCFEIRSYNDGSWFLRWKKRPLNHFRNEQDMKAWNAKNSGNDAQSIDSNGYNSVQLNGEKWKVHRIIWKMHFGLDPKGDIDHIDQNKLNNNINNLRETDDYSNSKNMRKFKNNTSGVTGVNFMPSRQSKPWRAQIHWQGKKKNLGNFATKEEAIVARKQAEKTLGYTNL